VKIYDPDGRTIKVGPYILPYRSAGVPYRQDYARADSGSVAKVASARGFISGFHRGVDSHPAILPRNARGDYSIVSVADGRIERTGYDREGGGGHFVVINHGKDAKGNTIRTKYFHLKSIAPNLKKGRKVFKDQKIGNLGNTHNSSWHSHFEVWKNDNAIDPKNVDVEKMTQAYRQKEDLLKYIRRPKK
jgi:murein DD-endopeptidase MepM/ murein hydrolase activator NlpD